jgi:hypothetical protein
MLKWPIYTDTKFQISQVRYDVYAVIIKDLTDANVVSNLKEHRNYQKSIRGYNKILQNELVQPWISWKRWYW